MGIYRRFGTIYFSPLHVSSSPRPLKVTDMLSRNVSNYLLALRNIPEGRRSRLRKRRKPEVTHIVYIYIDHVRT
jgi:hypothetical protein